MGNRDDSTHERRRPITVVLVDDESLIRHALARELSDSGLDLVGEAGTGEEAMEMVVALRPDVVVMDVRLPDVSGVEVIERLGGLAPGSRVLVLTRLEQNHVVEAIVAGASGYILKSSRPEVIIDAIRATSAGEAVLSPKVAGKLLAHIREQKVPTTASSELRAGAIRAALTKRELEIFSRLASGEGNQDIARELSMSVNTVSNHIASILSKLQLENRIQAAVQAVRAGIS
jgi:DNA-binding NarL/FixJ family response regulator